MPMSLHTNDFMFETEYHDFMYAINSACISANMAFVLTLTINQRAFIEDPVLK